MAGCKVIVFAFVSVGLLVSVTRAQLFLPCNYTEVQGPYCLDCQTRAICTPLGGIPIFRCWLPHLKHCVDGHCAREPSPECAPTPPSPSTTPEEPSTTEETTPEESSTEGATPEEPSTEEATTVEPIPEETTPIEESTTYSEPDNQ